MSDGLPISPSVGSTSPLGPNTTRELFAALRAEMTKVLVGQLEVLEQLLLTVLCREHALLVSSAGTGKWSAVEALGRCLGLITGRVRSSSDLNLDDLLGQAVGTDPWQSSLLVVEQVDSLPAKLRNLIHQAMSERVVDARGVRHAVPDPFVVFATRYPSEDPSRGPADSADDRFLFQIDVPYPSYHDEYVLAATKSGSEPEALRAVVTRDQLDAWRILVSQIESPPSVVHYAVRLVRATRVHEGENPDFVYEWVTQGAGPRAAHFLILAAKARATLRGRAIASHDDVRAVCPPILRHRILTNQNARSNGISSDRVIQRLLDEVPPRIVGDETIPGSGDAFTFHDWIPEDDSGE